MGRKRTTLARGGIPAASGRTRPVGFVCYAREDERACREFRQALEGAQVDPVGDWLLTGGSPSFRDDVDDQIEGADAVVLLLSGHLEASEECRREIRRALDWGKRIVPVRIDEQCEGEQLPDAVRGAQWILDWPAADEAASSVASALRTDFELLRFASRILRAARDWEAGRVRAHLDAEDRRRFELWAHRAAVEPALLPRPTQLATRFAAAAWNEAGKRRRRVVAAAAVLVLLALAALATAYSREMLRRNADSIRATARTAAIGSERAALRTALDAVRPAWLPTPTTARIGLARALVAAERRFSIGRFEGPLLGLEFAPDGRVLALLTARGGVVFIDVEGPEGERRSLDVIGSAVGFDPDGLLIVGTEDGELSWVDPGSGAISRVERVCDAGIRVLAAASSERLAFGDALGRVFLWKDSARGAEVEFLTTYGPGWRLSLAVTTDGGMVASSAGRGLRLHDVESGRSLHETASAYLLQGYAEHRRLLAVDEQGRIVSATTDPPQFGFFGLPRRPGDARLSSAVQSRTGDWIVTGSDNGKLHVWAGQHDAPVGEVLVGPGPVDRVAATAELDVLAVVDLSGAVQVFRARSRGESRVVQEPRVGTSSPPLLPEAQTTRRRDLGFGVVELEIDRLTGELRARFEDGLERRWPVGFSSASAASPTDTRIEPGALESLEPRSGEPALSVRSPDRSWQARAESRSHLQIRREGAREWRRLDRPGRISSLTALAFDPGSSMLAVGDGDGRVIVYVLEPEVLLVDSGAGPSAVTALAFDREGDHLAAGYADGCVATFSVSLRSQRELALEILAQLAAWQEEP